MHEWTHDVSLPWERLPKGDFFYHAAPFERLDSIKRVGLAPPVVHGGGKNWDIPFYPKERILNRLFLFPLEKDCLEYVTFYDFKHLMALRFGREAIFGAALFRDPGYQQNQLPRRKAYSFSADASVSPEKLEGCLNTRWDGRIRGYTALGWIPLAQITGPTIEVR